jgi:hypothetical protein
MGVALLHGSLLQMARLYEASARRVLSGRSHVSGEDLASVHVHGLARDPR